MRQAHSSIFVNLDHSQGRIVLRLDLESAASFSVGVDRPARHIGSVSRFGRARLTAQFRHIFATRCGSIVRKPALFVVFFSSADKGDRHLLVRSDYS